jgi:hypothetical protein
VHQDRRIFSTFAQTSSGSTNSPRSAAVIPRFATSRSRATSSSELSAQIADLVFITHQA